ncbi:MAG: polysaccharide pyruvyl transferase family protein, partial [Acidimicrobiia bacterium]|nr:polysaccharide pyruvyl transferase family protein [Acidimicrobiia bacterium]
IRYVGWTGKENLGDDALLQAISGVLDWGRVQTSKRGDLLLLGGGTLIGRDPYIDWIEETDSPRIERAVFGTGVANPKFWGSNDDARRWVEWLDTCALIGVRGPFSAQILADWGVHRDVEVIGDAALLLTASAPKRDGLVVISPCRTRGESWGGDDESVVSALVSLARKLTTDGHDVSVLAAHPDDDGMCIRVLSEVPGTTYFAGYRDVGASMEHFASAGLVVAERLHSAVLAAAVGTPFVGIEYRPKVADFATSVGMAGQVLRTDQLGGLEELVIGSLAATDRLVETFSPRVEEYRDRLRRAAADLRDTMRR